MDNMLMIKLKGYEIILESLYLHLIAFVIHSLQEL